MDIKKVTIQDGNYICDIDISSDEWKEIIQDEIIMSSNYKDALLKFYNEPNHKSTCKTLGEKHKISPQSLNGTIMNFGKAVQKRLNRFEIVGTDDKPTYWIISMTGKSIGEHFEWTLRPELVKAIRETYTDNNNMNYWTIQLHPNNLGWKKEIELLSNDSLIGMGDWDEKTSQQLQFQNEMRIGDIVLIRRGSEIIALVKVAGDYEYTENTSDLAWFERRRKIEILDWYKDEYKLNVSARKTLERCQNRDTATFSSIFKWLEIIKQQNMLTQYTGLLKSNMNLILTGAPGTGKTYLAKQIAEEILKGNNNGAIREESKSILEIDWNAYYKLIRTESNYAGADHFTGRLNVIRRIQDLFKSEKSFFDFSEDERKYIAGTQGKIQREQLGNEDSGFFGQMSGSGVFASEIKANNHKISNALDEISSKGDITKQNFDSFVKKFEEVFDRNIVGCASRLLAMKRPDFFICINGGNKEGLKKDFESKDIDKSFDNYWKFIQKIHQSEWWKNPMPTTEVEHDVANARLALLDSIYYDGTITTLDKIAGLSLNNLSNIEFVQFHPSYDYTDFVEGLRPTAPDENGNIGFERKNGSFKEFCRKASVSKGNKNISKLYDELCDQIKNGYIKTLKLKNGEESQQLSITLHNGNDNIHWFDKTNKNDSRNAVTKERLLELYKKFNSLDKLNTMANINDEIRSVINGCNASMYWAVLNYLLNQLTNKPYVFIIDEINRGEISKIFGELFFSIDPGYRGEKGRVQTQYANLIDDNDVFKEGFYVPDNVYIIGTMNDIDRSVESMDFAMRRRFAWKEIKAIDRISMWDGNIEQWKEEAKQRMISLNNIIWNEKEMSGIRGLSPAYHIGPAYFLKLENYNGDFERLWENHLKGVLSEYLRGFPNTDEELSKLENAYNLR